ncbi:hypothetical protein CR513_55161, partial [Mucuna pruriens]
MVVESSYSVHLNLAANKVKWLEVVYMFDIKQMKGENLKGYLVRFNSKTIQVNDTDKKFFVKAF